MLNSLAIGKSWGQILKEDLGLSRFKSVVIRRVINMPLYFFIVYYNSRFPNIYIPYARIKALETVTLKKLKRYGSNYKEEEFRMTPPLRLENLNAKLPSNSIILKIDITGEWFANKKLYRKK